MTKPFVHLHVHSDYSMLDGACQVKKLCQKVKDLGQSAVAISDHGNMSSAIELTWASKGLGIKPIYASEFYIVPPRGTKVYKSYAEESSSKQTLRKSFHLILLAKNDIGYQNLCKLNSISFSEDKILTEEECKDKKEFENGMNKHFYYKPRITREDLVKHSEGLIGLTACIGGEIPANVLEFVESADGERGMPAARRALEFYIETFGRENFYLELQYHAKPGVEPNDVLDASHRNLLELEKRSNAGLLELSKEYGVELVCTNDAHYLNEEDSEAHDALLCIGTQSMLADPKRFKFSGDQFFMKTSDEMYEIFKDFPRAAENTVKIAEKCDVTIPFGVNHYPVFRLEDESDAAGDAHCLVRRRYLLDICFKGVAHRYKLYEPENENYVRKSEEEPDTEFRKEILDRMHFELGVIDRMGYVSYFLVVWDFINYARSQDIPVGPGRGSGAGSIVAYLTGITDLDPLLYGLLFERFLNPDRVSPPDFDIDFCERRRGEVIEYVRDKYGSDSVAQIGTYGTLKTKAVLKGVARVMGIPFADANVLVGTIPTDPKMTLEKALKLDEVKAIYDRESWVREVFSKAEALEGLISNQSIHACGVIIGAQPLANIVPLARGAGKEIITQFPAYPCEELGLLKMDFLGLKTLTIIQDTLDLVNRYSDGNFTPDDIPLTCEKTYKLLNRGATTGVFQLESGGMQELCRNFRISKIEEIIALVALYRPGPMEFIPTFIRCKIGEEEPEYETKEMKELLSETYGIMVYQEQIMQVVQAVAGFSLAQADIMRRAIGKKKESVLIEQGEVFVKGCVTMGHTAEIAEKIWVKILKFASYGFNKSHSACYGLLSYRTAYLKANHPAEFMAAILNAEINNSEKLAFYIAECKEMGINILPPDVNVSLQKFSVDTGNIRFGIAGLKGVGSAAAAAIITAQADGNFKDLIDFCERTGSKVNKRVMENLCKAGAFDMFGFHRSQIMGCYEQALSMAKQTIDDRASGQGSLFDMFGMDDTTGKELDIPNIPEWDELELLGYEKELLGFYVSGHPLGENAELIRLYGTHVIAKLCTIKKGDVGVLTGGMINTIKSIMTKKGDRMAILDIEDLEGHTEVVVFPKTYQKVAHHLESGNIIFVSALTDAKDQSMNLLAENIFSMEEMQQTFTKEVHIRLAEGGNTLDEVSKLQEICASNHGLTPVVFCITCSNGDIGFVKSHLKYYVDMSERFVNQVKALLGSKVLYYKPDHSLIPERKKRWTKQPAQS